MCSGGGGGGDAVQYEPVKNAQDKMKSATDSTARAQELRRGITSTFNRNSMRSAGGTSGTATKLGA